MHKIIKNIVVVLAVAMISVGVSLVAAPAVYADTCGDPATKNEVKTSIEIGCVGKGNPINDMAFAIIRFLSAGVGLVMIGSLMVAGVQYSMSRGNPQEAAAAQKRIETTVIALLIFIFGFAFLNYVIPAGFLK